MACVAALFFATTESQAAIFNSAAGNANCTKSALATGGAGACVTVAITPHAAWQPNNPGGSAAVWVSYGATGVGGGTFQPHTPVPVSGLAGTWIFMLTETFIVPAGDSLLLNFSVWGDDTVEVLLDGLTIFPPNFTQNICANGAIGCQPGEAGIFALLLTTPGVHSLSFLTYQIGTGTNTNDNPFGILYAGQATLVVPEPGTLALLGLGVLAVGGAAARSRRRRNRD
jgi:hypothetical protein